MKFKEFLNETASEAEVQKYLKDFRIESLKATVGKSKDAEAIEKVANGESNDLEIGARNLNGKGPVFSWPFAKSPKPLDQLSIGMGTGAGAIITIENCEEFMDTDFLNLHRQVIIKSLKGIENLHSLDHIGFFMEKKNLQCGLLRLFKCPNLTSIIFSGSAYYGLEDVMMELLKGDKDIIECQDALINAGFEEYAKL